MNTASAAHAHGASLALSLAEIATALGGLAARFDVDALAECDSTNSRLLARAEAGAPSGTVIVAERQTAGRGRRGRDWLAAPGASLTFSLLWRFPPDTALDGLSLAVGVALAQALESLGVSGVQLKWPNDILLNGRKLAGVLIEIPSGARTEAAVIGIGTNLHALDEMPNELRATAATLDEAATVLPSPNILLARLLTALHRQLSDFARHGLAGCRREWLVRHAWTGRPVRALMDFGAPVDGLCHGIDEDGALLLETTAGMQRIVSGDVSLRAA